MRNVLKTLIGFSLVLTSCGPGMSLKPYSLVSSQVTAGGSSSQTIYKYFLYGMSPINGKIYGFSVNKDTGELTAVPSSPYTPGGGSNRAATSIDGRYLFVSNGNNYLRYSINSSTGELTALGTTPSGGFGVYGVKAYPSGGWLFGALSGSNAVDRVSISGSGGLSSSGSTATGTYTKDVTVHPSKNFVYTSNGTSNDISGFTFNSSTGALTAMAGSPYTAGTSPEGLAIHPNGLFLYATNNGSNTVSRFDINQSTGVLSGETTIASGVSPWIISMHPSGSFLYTANGNGGASVSGYSVNSSTGALTALAGSPYSTGADTRSVAVLPNGNFLYVAGYSNNFIGCFTIGSNGIPTSQVNTSTGTDLIHDLAIATVAQ